MFVVVSIHFLVVIGWIKRNLISQKLFVNALTEEIILLCHSTYDNSLNIDHEIELQAPPPLYLIFNCTNYLSN